MGILCQSSHGGAGNFELVLHRGAGGGATHWWRDNDDPGLPWHGPTTAFGSAAELVATSLIQGNFGSAGNLEVIGASGGKLVHSFRDDGGSWTWKTPTFLPGTAAPSGGPGFVQGRFGAKGNFEVIAPLAGGGMGHWWRDNDDPVLAWHGPTPFGSGQVAATALAHGVHSNHLEVVARVEDHLQHWWRDGAGVWHPAGTFASGVAGVHDLCQSTFTFAQAANYEVVAPLAGGGMGHWWADPTAGALSWTGPNVFGAGQILAVGLIQSHHWNLEVIAVFADHLEHWWREAAHPFAWHGPTVFWDAPTFLPEEDGACEIPYGTGVVGVHAALLRTARVVLWSFADFDDSVGMSQVLDPATGALTTPPESHHVFCSGHAFAPDGSLVVSGGHHGDVKAVHTFDPASETWVHVADMPTGRWYPTTVALPDGRILTVSGSVHGGPLAPGNPANNTIELYDAVGGLRPPVPLPSPWSSQFPPHLPTIDLYPFVFLLPSGHLVVHARHVTRLYDPASDIWGPELSGVSAISRTYPCQGSAVLLPLVPPEYRPRVLVLGGAGANPEEVTGTTPAVATAEILDLADPTPAWRSTSSMAHPRVMPDAVLLPDASVLVTGGSMSGEADHGIEPVYAIERFDPASETWTTLCDIAVPRLYHSTALLLADGRVLMMGKDALFNPDPFHYPEHRAELFRPPYLFAGSRPLIAAAPASISYGQAFAVSTPDATSVDAVHLLRPGSVTHSFNMEQRLVGLVVASRSTDSLTVEAPPDARVAPPGWYLLFLLADGVPSVGHFLRLG